MKNEISIFGKCKAKNLKQNMEDAFRKSFFRVSAKVPSCCETDYDYEGGIRKCLKCRRRFRLIDGVWWEVNLHNKVIRREQ